MIHVSIGFGKLSIIQYRKTCGWAHPGRSRAVIYQAVHHPRPVLINLNLVLTGVLINLNLVGRSPDATHTGQHQYLESGTKFSMHVSSGGPGCAYSWVLIYTAVWIVYPHQYLQFIMCLIIYYVTLSFAQYKKIKPGKRRFKDMYII